MSDIQENTIGYLLNEQNKPLKVYHGTIETFNQFEPLSHFGTKAAAQEAAYKYILRKENAWGKMSFEETANDLRDKYKTYMEKTKIIPVYLQMKNPLYISDLAVQGHTYETYKTVVLGELEKDNYKNLPYVALMMKKFPVLQSFSIGSFLFEQGLANVPPVVDMIFKDPFLMDEQDVVKELAAEKLYRPKLPVRLCKHLNASRLVYQRMIRFFERRGIDGFVYCNKVEDVGKDSYVAFRGGQVVRLDRIRKQPDLYPSKQNEEKLRQMEEKALARCKERPISDEEREDLLEYQELTVMDIPKAEIKKNKELKALVSQKVPNWKNTFMR